MKISQYDRQALWAVSIPCLLIAVVFGLIWGYFHMQETGGVLAHFSRLHHMLVTQPVDTVVPLLTAAFVAAVLNFVAFSLWCHSANHLTVTENVCRAARWSRVPLFIAVLLLNYWAGSAANEANPVFIAAMTISTLGAVGVLLTWGIQIYEAFETPFNDSY